VVEGVLWLENLDEDLNASLRNYLCCQTKFLISKQNKKQTLNSPVERKSLYAAFDLYPSSKGAATHIHHMSKALFQFFGSGYLYVLGNERLPVYQNEENVEIFRFNELIPNYLQRAETYGIQLASFISERKNLELVHFRDIWSGLAILVPDRKYKTVFEVNALMSIELPYRYPFLSKQTLEKIKEIENFCLQTSDQLICPSNSIKENLIKLQIPGDKIKVISNGADLEMECIEVPNKPSNYIIYFGALQHWQGVDDLIKAFAGLKDFSDLKLVICSSNRPSYSKPYRKLAEKLNVDQNIIWNYQLAKEELYDWVKHARLSVAPMKDTERNLLQGFSPLKVFESMALKTPVVGTDLPSIREIITDKENGRLVRPDRPAELSRVIRFMLDYPDYTAKLGQNGRLTIENNFSWAQKTTELHDIYSKLTKFENQ